MDRTAIPNLRGRQVAALLGISPATLYRMLARGEAPASYKLGAARLWSLADVLDWLGERRQEGGAQ